MIKLKLRIKNLFTRNQKGVEGCTGDVTIWPSVELKPVRGGQIFFLGRATIKENSFICAAGGKIIIEDYVSINRNACIVSRSSIIIGAGTSIGPNVCIYDHNHKFDGSGHKKNEFRESPITIGKKVWIAANCSILKGAQIGDNCIIGAGCVINCNIPSNSLVTQERNLKVTPLHDS